jgi:integrase
MGDTPEQSGPFQKVGECLYRHSSGTYYALVKHGGKQHRQSLKTSDPKEARRLLGDFRKKLSRTDPKQGRVTIAQLADRYLSGIAGMKPKTIATRTAIIHKLKANWPGGAHALARDAKPSTIETWLAGEEKRLRAASFNEYLRVVRGMFAVALKDKIIGESPVTRKEKRREKPNRLTPTWEEFKSIVNFIRNNKFSDSANASADLIEFMGLAGLGNAEAALLTWGDVDFKQGRIKVYRVKTDVGFEIPIYPQLRPFLERLKNRQSREENQLMMRKSSLFATPCEGRSNSVTRGGRIM